MDIISYALASEANDKVDLLTIGNSISVPSGTTAERPSLETGDRVIRYNTELLGLEEWNGTEWRNLSADITTITIKGTDTEVNILALSGMLPGDLWVASDTLDGYLYDGSTWINIGPLKGPAGDMGLTGATGNSIESVVRTTGDGSEGTTDTYTITFTDTSTSTFDVKNGTAGIINHITRTNGTGASGVTDTYTAYADAAETDSLGSFDVYNGQDGVMISIVAGTGVTIDSADPANPVISVGDTLPDQTGQSGKYLKTDGVTATWENAGLTTPDAYQGVYGISWDSATDTYIRTGAAGYTSIQSMMRRCTLNTDGTVNYYLNPTNSNFKENGEVSVLTGADGNVMDEVPKFYVKLETVGDVDKISLALTEEAGYSLHPAFIKGGVEVDYRYYRAYEGYNSGGVLKSISGVTPTRSQTIATFRTQAEANGTGWHQTDWHLLNAVRLLCYVEFADFKVTNYIGNGNDTGSDFGITTGQSNGIGNASSPSTNTDMWMSYRGIENFYADIWEFVDGVNINNYEFFVNGDYRTFASDVFTGDYVSTGVSTIAMSQSYIKRCSITLNGGFIPTVVGGSSATYYADGGWSATGARVAVFSGTAYHGTVDGPGALAVHDASAGLSASIGGAVCF